MIFSLPTSLTLYYAPLIKLVLGSMSPQLLIASSAYLAYKRHTWLRLGYYSDKSVKLVHKLEFDTENQVLVVTPASATKKNIPLSNLSISYHENEHRKDAFYMINVITTKERYAVPSDENSSVDHKMIRLLQERKNEPGDYDITSLLMKGPEGQIDISPKLEQESTDNDKYIDYAKISLFLEKNPKSSKMNREKIIKIVDSYSLEEVDEYVKQMTNKLQKSVQEKSSQTSSELTEEKITKDLESLFISFGLTYDNARRLAAQINRKKGVQNIKEVLTMTEEELKNALQNALKGGQVEANSLKKQIDNFLRNLK